MQTKQIYFHGVIIAFFILLLAGTNANAAANVVTQGELLNKLDTGTAPLILDVRTTGEYQSGHVPQAINIPHRELASRLAEIKVAKDQEVITYCEMGPRAGIAEKILRDAGFTNVRSLHGHMNAWRRNGLPSVKP